MYWGRRANPGFVKGERFVFVTKNRKIICAIGMPCLVGPGKDPPKTLKMKDGREHLVRRVSEHALLFLRHVVVLL